MKAMNEMQELMKSPKAMGEWFESKRQEFEALPDSKWASLKTTKKRKSFEQSFKRPPFFC